MTILSIDDQDIQDLGTEREPEKMDFAGLEVSLKWSRRRRTIGLTVTGEGGVVLSAPTGIAKRVLLKALNRHRLWLERKVAERREAWSRLKAGAVYFQGQACRLRLRPGAGAPVALGDGEIQVRAATAAAAWPLLQDWYHRQAETFIRERLNHFARSMNLESPRMELREWKRRWGECRLKATLRFNWRLILLPPEALDYVVVHELAHLREPGHTPRFWRQVAQVLPDHRERRRRLNHYGSPFLLWKLAGE